MTAKRRTVLLTLPAITVIVVVGAGQGAEKPLLSQQEQVVQALRSGPEAVDSAVKVLRTSSDPRLREAAAYVIGKSGRQELAQVLADSLGDSSEQVRRSAIAALQKVANRANVELEARYANTAFPGMDVSVIPAPKSLPPNVERLCSALRPRLKDTSPLVRAPAAETTGWLRCRSSIVDLQGLMHDPIEPVRFRASQALKVLTGKSENFIDLKAVVWGSPPIVAVKEVDNENEAQQLSPFTRAAFFEEQGKFSFNGGIPAQFQTVTHVWRSSKELDFEAECQDERPRSGGDDRLTFFLKPQGQSKLYQFEVVPSKGLVREVVTTLDGREEVTKLNASAEVERGDHEWKAHLQIPFEAFGLSGVSDGNIWGANVVRVESHRAVWGTEISSWTHFDRSFPSPPALGSLYFAEGAPLLSFHPAVENIYSFPVDGDSPAEDLVRPTQPAQDTLWGDIVAPDHLVRGINTFYISQKRKEGPADLQLRLVVYDHEARKVVTSKIVRLRDGSQGADQKIEIKLPETAESRAIDLEVTVSEAEAKHQLFSTRFICVPVISPPKRVTSFRLSTISDEKRFWKARSGNVNDWEVHDYGPMLMSESYPMALLEGKDGTVYGGTYPGGRLFSFNPAKGIVEDLGSPSPPANHLVTLVASPDGRLYGDLNRPRGRIFSYDQRAKKYVDLGIPVPGASTGQCQVMAYAHGRVYGMQRGHLFFVETGADRVVDKGSFLLDGKRYAPSKIASDQDGNVLGIAGGHLFRYQPESDEIRISDLRFDGWILRGPQGKLYTLFLDGRLFRWEPESDELVEVTRYASIASGEGPLYNDDPFRGMTLTLTATGELIGARSGMDDPMQTALNVYEPGGSQPINLGAPVAGSLFLTALTSGKRNMVFGLSTQRVYGVERTPVNFYSVRKKD